MLSALERMQNQLPPRLKTLLNLAISVCLLLFGVPLLWLGLSADPAAWGEVAMGGGILLLSIFNLFT